MKHIDADVLGKLILMQSTMHAMHGEEAIARFVCRGISAIPGVDNVSIYINGYFFSDRDDRTIPANAYDELNSLLNNTDLDDISHGNHLQQLDHDHGINFLKIETIFSLYGVLCVKTVDHEVFQTYKPYIENTLNVLALKVETDSQQELLNQQKQDLEKAVQARTRNLQESEERFKIIFEGSRDAIFLTTQDARFAHVNSAACRLTGYSKEELLQMSILDLHQPEDLHAFDTYFNRILSGEAVSSQASILRKDGLKVQTEFSNTRVFIGQSLYMHTVARDITDRKQAEQAIRKSEERLNLALDSVNDGVWDWRVDTGEVFFNSVWYTMLGYESKEMPPAFETWQKLLHPDDLPSAEETIRTHIELGKAFNIEFRMLAKDGSWRWILARGRVVQKDAQGQAVRMLGTHMDITDRKQSEKTIESINKSLQTILDSIPADIYVSDMQTHEVLFMNAQMKQSFGKDCVGEVCWKAFRSETGPCAHCSNLELLDDQGSPIGVKTWEGFNPISGKWYLNYDQAVPWTDGRYVRIQIALDISDRKQAEGALQQSNIDLKLTKEAAESANRAKSEFLANMSHEIRTPLNGIMGMLQVIQTTKLNEEQKEYVGMATLSTKRLTRLLNDILDLTKIEADRMEISEHAFEFSEVIQSIKDIFAHAVKENGNSLKISLDKTLPARIFGDSTRLTQILFNLVGNAVKYTHNGSVDVQTLFLPYGHKARYRILFIVSDTGSGIPDDKLMTIFEPFTQGNNAGSPYSRQYEGAGLGLPLVKRLADLMGGNISIDSLEGEGTAVYVSLPFSAPNDVQTGFPRERVDLASDESGETRLLLVDDDSMTQYYLKRLLGKHGYDVQVAANGQEALNTLKEQTFDCILMDIQMPVLDGVDTTKRIRNSQSRSKDVPIIAMTAYAMDGDREKFLANGMNDYIAKPVDNHDLFEVLKRHL